MAPARSLAMLQLKQGGANISARQRPDRKSRTMARRTARRHKSRRGSSIRSHSRAAKPACLIFFATDPDPEKQSAMYPTYHCRRGGLFGEALPRKAAASCSSHTTQCCWMAADSLLNSRVTLACFS